MAELSAACRPLSTTSPGLPCSPGSGSSSSTVSPCSTRTKVHSTSSYYLSIFSPGHFVSCPCIRPASRLSPPLSDHFFHPALVTRSFAPTRLYKHIFPPDGIPLLLLILCPEKQRPWLSQRKNQLFLGSSLALGFMVAPVFTLPAGMLTIIGGYSLGMHFLT